MRPGRGPHRASGRVLPSLGFRVVCCASSNWAQRHGTLDMAPITRRARALVQAAGAGRHAGQARASAAVAGRARHRFSWSDPAIMRRREPPVTTHPAHPTTRRPSCPPCPSFGHDSASRRPHAGGCDRGRRGREVPRLDLASRSRRWAIRWAKRRRIGPYQAHRESPTGAASCLDLQAFRCRERQRTPCFTRERTVVRNHPRPSSKGLVSRHFAAMGTTRPDSAQERGPVPRVRTAATARTTRADPGRVLV
jgi:hypothetical protein